MSARYDHFFLDIPAGIPEEDYVYDGYNQYKRIPGYYHYFISDDGRVISFAKENPIVLKTWTNQHGHKYVKLSRRGGYSEKVLVHRLVAEAFVPNPDGYSVVRHLDDNPDENDYRNLAWGTQMDNRLDCIRNGHDYKRSVYCFENDTFYSSVTECARRIGVEKSQITNCCKGNRRSAKGMHFCYDTDVEEKRRDMDWMRPRIQKQTVAYGPNGEQLYFSSRNEASKALGIPACGISSVVNGYLNHTHGWRFEEGEMSEQH